MLLNGKMEIIFLRHSTTKGNEHRRFNGTTDDELSEAGIQLAEERAAIVPVPEHVYVSPLTRCGQTAEILWRDIDKTVVDELREMSFGPFEGKNHEELEPDALYSEWVNSSGAVAIPGLETIEESAERMIAALQAVAADAESRGFRRVAILSHGGALGSLFFRIGRPEREQYYDWTLKNCSGYLMELEKEPLGLRLISEIGDVAEDADDW